MAPDRTILQGSAQDPWLASDEDAALHLILSRNKISGSNKALTFTLTPLIDVIFLLLIFFMLSSQISPYSLLPIKASSNPTPENAAQEQIQTARKPDLLFIVSRGHISAGNEEIPLDRLTDALSTVKSEERNRVNILAGRSATIQDLVTALEAFKSAGFANVSVLKQSR